MPFFQPLPVDVGHLSFVEVDVEPVGPPRDIAGHTVPTRVLASTSEVAILLEGGWVYPQGLVLRFGARVRRSLAATALSYAPPIFHWHWPPHLPGAEFINVGVGYRDGSRFTNTDRPDAPAALHGLSGSGSSMAGWHEFWLSPAPPGGDIELWTRWVAAGVEETATAIPESNCNGTTR